MGLQVTGEGIAKSEVVLDHAKQELNPRPWHCASLGFGACQGSQWIWGVQGVGVGAENEVLLEGSKEVELAPPLCRWRREGAGFRGTTKLLPAGLELTSQCRWWFRLGGAAFWSGTRDGLLSDAELNGVVQPLTSRRSLLNPSTFGWLLYLVNCYHIS